jgi:hypothetical protein
MPEGLQHQPLDGDLPPTRRGERHDRLQVRTAKRRVSVARPALLAPTPASPLRLIDGARRLPNDGFPIGFPVEPLGGRTAGAWSYGPPRRNVLAVGPRSATFSRHVTSIAAEIAHGLSDRAA